MRIALPVQLSAGEARRLRILCKRKRIEARVHMRSRIVLLAADKGTAPHRGQLNHSQTLRGSDMSGQAP